jgi:undecaprenyl-diphosphatase
MIEFLEGIDQRIVLSINGLHTPVLDEVMWFISGKLVWLPFYFLLIYLAYKKIAFKQLLVFIAVAILGVVFSDLICTYGFKEVFQRYRPSHNLLLQTKLHLYEEKPGEFYAGGAYGFISSHAANFFSLAIFIGLSLKKFYPTLLWKCLIVASVVSISRVYLGVHYVSDVFVGGLLGCSMGYISYRWIYLKVGLK